MPYELTRQTPTTARLRLWPHNALAPRGFALAVGLAAFALAFPMIALVGSSALWGLLPFAGAALWGLWYALERNFRDRRVLEEMQLSRDGIILRRFNPKGPVQDWQANPAWVTLNLIPRGGPVEHYLTLTSGGREVELGAFLTPEERIRLNDLLSDLLIGLKSYA